MNQYQYWYWSDIVLFTLTHAIPIPIPIGIPITMSNTMLYYVTYICLVYIVVLMSRCQEMPAIWIYFMINDGNQNKADCKLCSVKISKQ